MRHLLRAAPGFIGYLAIDLSLAIIGALITVPWAIARRQYERSRITGETITNAPRWLWLWGNDEDGFEPPWYRAITPGWGRWKRMYVWAAIRNSVNNLRFVPGFGVRVAGRQIHTEVQGKWTFYWTGRYYRVIYRRARGGGIAIGWKLEQLKPVGGIAGFGIRPFS